MEEKKCIVYRLKFPDEKSYIGITTYPFTDNDTEERFVNYKNGVYEAIKSAGWDNVNKEVQYINLCRKEALERKKELVLKYNSYLIEHGYNKPADAGIYKNKNSGENKPRSKRSNGKRKYYTVYVHITPNKKVYVGQTHFEAKKRWNNGKGYQDNKRFFQDILKYGWGNIHHIIICDTLNQKQANYLEEYLISRYNATDTECGYNIHNGGNISDGFRLQYEIAELMGKRFLNNDESAINTVRYFVRNYTREQLQNIFTYIKSQRRYIEDSISDKEFIDNRKKAAYIFEIIRNHAFI